MPLFMLTVTPELARMLWGAGLAYGTACGLLGGLLVWGLYPRDSIPRGTIKGGWGAAHLACVNMCALWARMPRHRR